MNSPTITYVRGDDYPLQVQLLDMDGDVIDISNSVIYFTVKKRLSDSDSEAKIQVSVSTHVNASEGLTQFPLTAIDTDLIGEFYYDVQISYTSGYKKSVVYGKIVFVNDVTKA